MSAIAIRQTRTAPGSTRTGPAFLGWVLYDGRCGLCRGGARRLGGIAMRRGFRLAPLQRAWVRRRLGLDETELMREMRVLTAEGQLVGGAAAYVHVARFVWWARPLVWFAAMPGGMRVLRRVYRWIARNRYCISGTCGLSIQGSSLGGHKGKLTRIWEL